MRPQDEIDCKLTTDWHDKVYPSERDAYSVHHPVRVFLAGPWFWPEAERALRQAFDVLNADKRFEVWCAMVHGKLDLHEYHALRAKITGFGDLTDFDFELEWDKKKEAAFQRDMHHIRWCDLLVGMIENWDSGTMFEFGGVRTLGKPCIAFSYVANRECNLMLERAIVGFTTDVDELVPLIEHKILNKKER